MEEMARTDPLTTLSNRRDILERIDYEYIRTERSGNPFSIIIGDVDNFKSINDRYGHDYGDYVLVTLADIFRKNLRKQDIVGRWGGEEFIFVMPDSNSEGGAVLAEKLRIHIEENAFDYRGDAVPVTMTFGVTECNGTRQYDVCITEADKALYAGKSAGKNQVVIAG
jgi:diguanylate cyclase (GGDEF)-like protein